MFSPSFILHKIVIYSFAAVHIHFSLSDVSEERI